MVRKRWVASDSRAGVSWLLVVLSAVCAGYAWGGSFEWNGFDVAYKATADYGVAIRTGSPDNALINGPIDPFKLVITPQAYANGFLFQQTGLPTTINFDDGDRNFKRFSLINNRLSVLGELQLKYDNYGVVASGDAFYDQVYHHPNDNDSPDTVNKTGSPTAWTAGARYYDGQRFRLLDAYAYGDWTIGDESSLDLRVGSHLVGWGESLFFSGIALAQGRADATKSVIPGAEIKEILLPVNQVSANFSVDNNLTLLGYYKLDYRPSELFPLGDYFSPSDAIGPGASFVYGSANPFYGNGCPGLITSLISNIPIIGQTLATTLGPLNPDQICKLNGAGGLLGAQPYILSYRGADLRPSNWGQYGAGLKYRLTAKSTVGAYYLRYHDANPSVVLNFGYPSFAANNPLLANILTTKLVNQPTPVSYQEKYFDGIDMAAVSWSTLVGPVNVAGEAGYRQKFATPVQAVIAGLVSPIFTRGKLAQIQTSAIYATNPDFIFDELSLVGEVGYYQLLGVDHIQGQIGEAPVGDGGVPFYSRHSWGFQTLVVPGKRNLFEGWDLSTPLTFGMIVKGNPALAGAFGALYGEGDMRLSTGASLQYLENLQFGLTYNFFFGDPNKLIGPSTLHANPYADRDYAAFNVKYNF